VRQKFPQARVAESAPASGAQRKSNKPASPATTVGKDTPLDWIGAEVNGLRKARGYSLQDLAQKCGKSVGYLSQLERGMSTPTIGALHNVAEALGVQTSWFFPQGEVAEPSEGGVIVRRQRRRQLAFDSGIRDYLLSPNLSGRIELLWSVMEPGADSGEAYHHQGEEAGVVIRGALELWVNGIRLIPDRINETQFSRRLYVQQGGSVTSFRKGQRKFNPETENRTRSASVPAPIRGRAKWNALGSAR
jgi:transcriptional regulator with XRE-family HTH domain